MEGGGRRVRGGGEGEVGEVGGERMEWVEEKMVGNMGD